jgi:hypothetical protein
VKQQATASRAAAATWHDTAVITGAVTSQATAMRPGAPAEPGTAAIAVSSRTRSNAEVHQELQQAQGAAEAGVPVRAGACGLTAETVAGRGLAAGSLLLTDVLRLLAQISASSSSSLAAVCVAASLPHQIMGGQVLADHVSGSHLKIVADLLVMLRCSSSSCSREVNSRSRCLLQDPAGTTSLR